MTRIASRVAVGALDVYNTGRPRRAFYYPAFGVYKFSLYFYYGDITADVRNIQSDERTPGGAEKVWVAQKMCY